MLSYCKDITKSFILEIITMKRLKNILLSMNPQSTTYEKIYEGEIIVVSADGRSSIEYSSVYYSGNIGFEITKTHKLAQDKPTITISIPFEYISTKQPAIRIQNHIADYCLREFAPYIDALNDGRYNRSRPDNENGKYYLHHPGSEVMARNTSYFALCPQKDYEYGNKKTVYLLNNSTLSQLKMCICIRMMIQLPNKNLKKAIQMLCHDLPNAVERYVTEFDNSQLNRVLDLAEKQINIRTYLKNSEYCAFIANGSILPRINGTNLPMENAVPFQSTPDDEIEVCGVIGMGIKRGVTIITGGGYSGKSTLLDAISAGIYDHVLGDGRELCITDDTAMTISAEDGRSVKSVNISPFIKWLPGSNTKDFSTDHASGSTSQAANIMEAVDYGAKLLLIDEDRSATNFMIRDKLMKKLIEKEPITPFTDRVNELYKVNGVSTILVIDSSGEYLAIADKIYMMDDFVIHDVTTKSKEICASHEIFSDLPIPTQWIQHRILLSDHFSSYPEGSGSERLEVSDLGFIIIGDEQIDIRGLSNIITKRQLNALGFMLRYLEIHNNDRIIDINQQIDDLYISIDKEGLDIVYSDFFTTTERFLDLPRKQELKAVINRMRRIIIKAECN